MLFPVTLAVSDHILFRPVWRERLNLVRDSLWPRFNPLFTQMHLYLVHNPRTLYLLTDSHDQRLGHPHRALTFRAAAANASQVIVEFLPGDEVNLAGVVKLAHRAVKGCLGLISVENGAYTGITVGLLAHTYHGRRYIPCGGHCCC